MFTTKMVATLTCANAVINPVNGVKSGEVPHNDMTPMHRILVEVKTVPVVLEAQVPIAPDPAETIDYMEYTERYNAWSSHPLGESIHHDARLDDTIVNHKWYDVVLEDGETIPMTFINHCGNKTDAPTYFRNYIAEISGNESLSPWEALDLLADPDPESLKALQTLFEGWNDYLINETISTVIMTGGDVPASWALNILLEEGLIDEGLIWRTALIVPVVLALGFLALLSIALAVQNNELRCGIWVLNGIGIAGGVTTTVGLCMQMSPESAAATLNSTLGRTDIPQGTDLATFDQTALIITSAVGGTVLVISFVIFVFLQCLGKARKDNKRSMCVPKWVPAAL